MSETAVLMRQYSQYRKVAEVTLQCQMQVQLKVSNVILFLSESEEQVSPIKDVAKHETTLSEKREDRVDYLYNNDGVGVLPVQETIREVR